VDQLKIFIQYLYWCAKLRKQIPLPVIIRKHGAGEKNYSENHIKKGNSTLKKA
jgi:hypothetical protein